MVAELFSSVLLTEAVAEVPDAKFSVAEIAVHPRALALLKENWLVGR